MTPEWREGAGIGKDFCARIKSFTLFFINLILERGRQAERERERERNIDLLLQHIFAFIG